jgi:uncharacterized protein (TIGR02246 family)
MTGSLYKTMLAAGLAAALVLAGCTPPPPPEPPDPRPEIEQTIRELVFDWSGAAEEKDVEKFVSFYAADGSLMLHGRPKLTGHEAIRAAATELFAAPGFHLNFGPTSVEVARSGEMAYEVGTYTLKTQDARKREVTEEGKYLVVWKKQADGAWKVKYDIVNADK